MILNVADTRYEIVCLEYERIAIDISLRSYREKEHAQRNGNPLEFSSGIRNCGNNGSGNADERDCQKPSRHGFQYRQREEVEGQRLSEYWIDNAAGWRPVYKKSVRVPVATEGETE